MTLIDGLRALVMGQAIFVFLLAILAIARYTGQLIAAPKGERALPTHIVAVATSYLMLVGAMTWEIFSRLGDPVTWRTPFALVAFALGDAALISLLVHLSLQRILVGAVLARAQKETADELKRQNKSTKAHLQRIEEAAIATHEDVQKAAKEITEKVAEVGKKADQAHEVSNSVNEKIATLHGDLVGLQKQAGLPVEPNDEKTP